jgi:hypothetical protein
MCWDLYRWTIIPDLPVDVYADNEWKFWDTDNKRTLDYTSNFQLNELTS